MCRWLACAGTPVLLDTVLHEPVHSLIDRSLHSRTGVETTNGDGFGVGWYAPDDGTPAVVRDTGPARSDRHLREIADHVRSPLFFAHLRATTGTLTVAVTHGQQTWAFRHSSQGASRPLYCTREQLRRGGARSGRPAPLRPTTRLVVQ